MPGKKLVVADTLSRNPQAALSKTLDTQEDVPIMTWNALNLPQN